MTAKKSWARIYVASTLVVRSAMVLLVIIMLLSPSLQSVVQADAGDLDLTFGDSGAVITDFFGESDSVQSILIQPDGKIVVAGATGLSSGDFALTRYNPDGGLDSGFGSGGKVQTDLFNSNDLPVSVLLQEDGKIVLVGRAQIVSTYYFAFVRYNADGSLDSSFGTDGKIVLNPFSDFESQIVREGVIQPDGRIIAVGSVLTNGEGGVGIVRINSEGDLDTTFGSEGKVLITLPGWAATPSAAALQPDGKLVIGGYSNSLGVSSFEFVLARLNSDGSIDTSFGTGGMVLADITGREDLLYELGIQADGKIVASGISPTLPGIWHFTTARFNSAGSLDSTFGTGGGVITQIEGYSRPFSLAFQGDGKILVAGSATTGSALVRYNRDGSLDLSFGSEGKVVTSFDNRLFAIVSMAVQPDGKIVGGGTLSNEISKEDFCVLRYEAGCVQYITSSSQSISANGGIGSISVSNIGDCPWTAVSNNPEFITITSTDNETVTFTVTPNLNTTPRSGTITVVDQVFMVFQGAAFLDVPPSHPFYTEIGKLSARGITLGCGDGNYCPDQVVSREQMAAFIIRALGDFNPPAPVTQSFTDVPPENPFYAFIEQIALRKITLGCGGGNYCPSDPVLREQKAAFIIRALHPPGYIPPEPAMQRFLDVPPINPFYSHIEEMAVRQITLGCGGGNYCPTQSVTRAQMAAFLVRAFNL